MRRANPCQPTGLELTVTRFDDAALFTICQSGLPAGNCGVAWTREAEEEIWPWLSGSYEEVYCGSMEATR